MTRLPLFAGLVIDEYGQPVDTALVGDEPCYVVDDAGFRRHIPSAEVDRQVLAAMRAQVAGMEDELSVQAAKMLGQDDLFTVAMIRQQLENMEEQFETLLQTGFPEELRAYLGMMGFRVVINVHGEVLHVEQGQER